MTTPEQEEGQPLLRYKYTFTLPEGGKKEFNIALDRATLGLTGMDASAAPAWTALSNRKCASCPLKEAESPRCPAAVALAGAVEVFKSAISYEKVHVVVETEQRDYEKDVPLQKGLSGLVGLLMASSGCPILKRLRPLIRYHLPFANLHETQFRILSMYLLGQYLLSRRGKTPDWGLKGLAQLYQEISEVNQSFMSRLLTVVKGDAGPNAMVILSAFTDAITFTIDGKMLGELEAIYDGHLG